MTAVLPAAVVRPVAVVLPVGLAAGFAGFFLVVVLVAAVLVAMFLTLATRKMPCCPFRRDRSGDDAPAPVPLEADAPEVDIREPMR
ncbi:MAG TPA: hypothetical protein VE631_02915 [Alphaproteobacteria bacterium]|nr:hypothetical protein [Alphaproteobacteria bacterium]